MRLAKFIALLSMFTAASLLIAQEDAKLISGPATGKFVPGAFECMNLNGQAKGRPRCLVCKFALSPAVLIFAQHPGETHSPLSWGFADENDEVLGDFIKRLEETMAEYYEDRGFAVGVIFLTPDARDASNNVGEDRSSEILREALHRERLTARLSKRAKDLNHVVIAYHLDGGPKAYNINPNAEYTVIFYERMKVLDNWTYAPGKMTAKDVDGMTKRIREVLPTTAKKKRPDDKD